MIVEIRLVVFVSSQFAAFSPFRPCVSWLCFESLQLANYFTLLGFANVAGVVGECRR